MRAKFTVISLLICIVYSLQVFAGTTGKITGVVKDKSSGEPLIGVNVIVDGTTLGATTDLDGSYIILNVPPGKYTILYQYIGYQEVQVTGINVSVDFTTRNDVDLAEASVELGDVITVVSEKELIRRDLTSSQAEITAEEIQEIPSENFEELLQLQAGVSVDDQGGFHIRGGRSSEVAFWVDGVSVTDGYDGSNAVEIENNAIQSLQVISGTFNAEYGQSMSGIINIVTKDGGDKLSGSVSAFVGDYFSQNGYSTSQQANSDNIYLNLDGTDPGRVYNFRASLDGPIPGTKGKARFFANFRRSYDDGWLHGQRKWRADGDTVQAGDTVLGTPGDNTAKALNSDSWYSGQFSLSYQLATLVKLRAKFDFEDRTFNEYDHFYKFNPDGDFTKFQKGINTSLTLDHTLGSRTFYTLKASHFRKQFNQYVYEDPEDPRYVDPTLFSVPANNFSVGGQKNQHFFRKTQTNIGKFDITSQAADQHLLKGGIEFRFHQLDFEDFQVIDGTPASPDYTPTRPLPGDPNYSAYTFKPWEFSAYIQDKLEYEDFIINAGLRFDYFNSQGRTLADPLDPDINSPLLPEHQALTLAEREEIWYKDTEPKFQVSPRIGVAYPISVRGVIHFSYGHFLQIPEFQRLYQNSDFRVTRSQGIDNLIGNADLDAQRTIMYELGLQQELTRDIGVDVTGFFRDIRGWVGTSPLKPTYAVDVFYSQYENQDYANVRGITMVLRKRFSNNYSLNLDYTFQVAEGNASNPDDAFNDIKSNKEPRRTIIPLNWDRSHILTGNVYYGYRGWGASLLGRFESGLPFTPNPVQGSRIGASIQSGLRENSGRRPNLLTFDLQFYRDFTTRFGNSTLTWNLFFKVFNLLDTRNEQIVYDDTGRATYTLQGTVSGRSDPEYFVQPQFYTRPRRAQLGLTLGF